MRAVNKKLTKVLFHPVENPGINKQVIISSDGLDAADGIFKKSGIAYVGVPVYIPIADSYISDVTQVTMTDVTKPPAVKKKKKES